MPTPRTNSGFLVVADITGYTAYLSHSELEHAQDVLKTLLDLLIDNTRTPLVLSGLEGDAVLSYTIDSERFEGQAFVEMIEQTYVAFKRAIESMVMNTSCKCNACANINALDLKFFVHHGEFVLQDLRGREELIGSDVNLIHRLMKNTIIEETGFRAYTFYTDAAIESLGLEEFADGFPSYSDDLDDIGVVGGRVMDMSVIWDKRKSEPGISIDGGSALRLSEDYPLPPEVVWGYLTNPEYRAIFSGARKQVTRQRKNGRVGAGTVYECFHGGNSVSRHTVLEWQPFDRVVTVNAPTKKMTFVAVFDFEPIEGGTRVTVTWGNAQGPKWQLIAGLPWIRLVETRIARKGMASLRQLMEADIAEGRVVVTEKTEVSDELRDKAASVALADVGSEQG